MPKRAATSLHGLTLAVLLPLGVLAALAWNGIQAQARSAMSDKQAELTRHAEGTASLLGHILPKKLHEVANYPDPPLPGSPSPADPILDGTDIAALVTLRDTPSRGLSPAGLPTRVLAALRIHQLEPERIRQFSWEKPRIVQLAISECPSILSETALSQMMPLDDAVLSEWKAHQQARRIALDNPEEGWFEVGDDLWWVGIDGDEIRYVSLRNDVDDSIRNGVVEATPRDVRTLLVLDRSEDGTPNPDHISTSAAVPFGTGLSVVSSFPTELLLRDVRRQQRWTFTIVGLAAMVSLGALFFIHRTLRRERQLNEMKSQFVASVSHELRAPVASIRLMADALEAEKVAPETAKEFHRLIAREGARLSTLVGNVLDHARIEQGKRVWKMEPCDLESLVADTLRVMEPLAKEKNITLSSALSPLEAAVDAGAIQQALVNLLDNAIKFSTAGSTVETSLSIDEERRTWRIAVRDEGPGIAKAEQSRIFERFYRPGDELRRETQGTGIGLSLVKAIAEAHGGSVTVESEPGHGSIFKLTGPPGTAVPQTGSKPSDCRSEDRRSRET